VTSYVLASFKFAPSKEVKFGNLCEYSTTRMRDSFHSGASNVKEFSSQVRNGAIGTWHCLTLIGPFLNLLYILLPPDHFI